MRGDRLGIEMMARRDDWQWGISLFARQVTVGMGQTVAQPLVFSKHEPEGSQVEPFMRLDIEAAQKLMDELWQCGLRPSEGTGSAGSLKATENHLDDMRKIVFNTLEIGSDD